MFALVDRIEADGIALAHVDLGAVSASATAARRRSILASMRSPCSARGANRSQRLLLEPGRFLVGNAGVLLTRVLYLKPGDARDFAIVDAAMNDLIRPGSLRCLARRRGGATARRPLRRWQIVGPVCESADFLAHDRDLALEAGDLLAVRSAGAYAFAMSSNYNSRPRACEVVVDGLDRRISPVARDDHGALRARILAPLTSARECAIHARCGHRKMRASNPECECANSQQSRMQGPELAREILQSGKIWLEFMQQVEWICQEAVENSAIPKDRNRPPAKK